jgi:predicted acetyltransferase
MTQPYPLRAVTAEEFPAFTEVGGQAFLKPWDAEAIEYERQITEYDRTFAACDGQLMVGTASSYSFRLTVPGGVVPAAGITNVAVLPSYRRQGIMRSLIENQLAGAISLGEPVAVLFASEPGIYGRFGFGQASSHLRLKLHRGDGAMLDRGSQPGRPGLRLRECRPATAGAELASVYEACLGLRPGGFARDERWWNALLGDPAFQRDGMSPLRCIVAEDQGGPQGYALYRTRPDWADGTSSGTLHIRELMTADPACTALVWSDLLSRDLVGEVIAPVRPVDDPLLAMLANPRRTSALLSDGLWVRLTDLPAALSQRTYAAGLDVVLDVRDTTLPANAGRWRLRAGNPADGGNATCERTQGAADLELSVQALAAGYLGSRIGQLAAAGQITELTPGALSRLSAAMSHDPAPWSCMIF